MTECTPKNKISLTLTLNYNWISFIAFAFFALGFTHAFYFSIFHWTGHLKRWQMVLYNSRNVSGFRYTWYIAVNAQQWLNQIYNSKCPVFSSGLMELGQVYQRPNAWGILPASTLSILVPIPHPARVGRTRQRRAPFQRRWIASDRKTEIYAARTHACMHEHVRVLNTASFSFSPSSKYKGLEW